MTWWTSLAHRLGYFGRRRRFDAELEAELRFHFESHIEELEQSGLSREAAVAQARRRFGSRSISLEDARQAWQFRGIEHGFANVRYALRQCRKHPGFAAVVVLTLGLGIGANSAVFSAIDAIVLRPLPFPEGDRLMRIHQINPRRPFTFAAPARFTAWDRLNTTFQAITGYYTEDAFETSGELPEKLTRAVVAPRFLEVWGVAPALGRDLTFEAIAPGAARSVLISDRLWRRKFGADPNAVGRSLRFGGMGDAVPTVSATVVGVMPASFLFPVREVDVWAPAALARMMPFREANYYTAVGRLKRGVTLAQAAANLSVVQAQLGTEYPQTDADLRIGLQPLAEDLAGRLASSLWMLFGSAGVLLLIACVNVTALMLVRAVDRRHEISLRASLGASRTALMGQLMTEVGVLTAAGAVLGLAIAAAAARLLHVAAQNLPRVDEIAMDWRVVSYSLAMTVAVTLMCGLLPAIRATRRDLSCTLAQGGRTQVSGRGRLQWVLVAAQVSLAVILLAAAGLLVRSFQELGRIAPGFEPSRVLTFQISGAFAEVNDYPRLIQRVDRTLEFLRTIPGIEQAATAATVPGVPGQFEEEIRVVGRSESKIAADSRYVSAGYFTTMRIPFLSGDQCPERGAWALVNQSFANAHFAGTSPVGQHLTTSTATTGTTIRGIVGDAREQGLHRAPSPTVYWCASAPRPSPFYFVRTSGRPAAMAETVRRKIKEIEPARSVFDIAPLDDRLGEAYSENRLRMMTLASFALTAVLLACVGLYGTLSYLVTIRRREVGLRLALGAMRGQIVRRYFGQGLGVSVVACAAGLGVSVLLNRALASMLIGVSSNDPFTLGGVALVVLTAAALASLVPSIRGALVEPVTVLRDE
jgi:putative ABC transport system permease protein